MSELRIERFDATLGARVTGVSRAGNPASELALTPPPARAS